MEHARQSRPYSGFDFQVKVLENIEVVPSPLGREMGRCQKIRRQTRPDSGLGFEAKGLVSDGFAVEDLQPIYGVPSSLGCGLESFRLEADLDPEYGTYKTIKAIFWPQRPGQRP
jgi:hypothetical protein